MGPIEEIINILFYSIGCKSERPLVKTPLSQNVPQLVKTSPNTKKDWSKRPHKTSPFSKELFRRNMGF